MPLPPDFWEDPQPPEPGLVAWEAWEEPDGHISVKVRMPGPVTHGQPIFQDGRAIGTIQNWVPTTGGKMEAVATIRDPEVVKAIQAGIRPQSFSMGVTNVRVNVPNLLQALKDSEEP